LAGKLTLSARGQCVAQELHADWLRWRPALLPGRVQVWWFEKGRKEARHDHPIISADSHTEAPNTYATIDVKYRDKAPHRTNGACR
jgi:hypothetical protein